MCNLKTEIKENESKADGETPISKTDENEPRWQRTNPRMKILIFVLFFPHGSKLNRIRMHKAALNTILGFMPRERKVVTALSFSDFLSPSLSAPSLTALYIPVSQTVEHGASITKVMGWIPRESMN